MLDICVSLLDYLKIFSFFFFFFWSICNPSNKCLNKTCCIKWYGFGSSTFLRRSLYKDWHAFFFFRLLDLCSIYDPWGCKVVILTFLFFHGSVHCFWPVFQQYRKAPSILSWGHFLRYKLQNLSRHLWLELLGLDHLLANPSFFLAAVSSHVNAVSPPEQDTFREDFPFSSLRLQVCNGAETAFSKKAFTSIQKWRKSVSVFFLLI